MENRMLAVVGLANVCGELEKRTGHAQRKTFIQEMKTRLIGKVDERGVCLNVSEEEEEVIRERERERDCV
jgi:hypothetical protein